MQRYCRNGFRYVDPNTTALQSTLTADEAFIKAHGCFICKMSQQDAIAQSRPSE